MDRYQIRYVSASGDVLELSKGAYDANGTELPSWELDAFTIGRRVVGFSRGFPEYSMIATVSANSEAEGIAAKNRLYEVTARDVASATPGRLYMGDWYMVGYMRASTVTNFWQTPEVAQYELTFMATTPQWTKEAQFSFTEEYTATGKFLDFPYDFPYDYGYSKQVLTVRNENFVPSPIMLRIFGAVNNPQITIAGNVYRVDVSLLDGEYLEIDGADSAVTVVRQNGERENAFPYVVGTFSEGSGSFIFQPIPTGESEVIWSGAFDFDIVVYERRDEPRWS